MYACNKDLEIKDRCTIVDKSYTGKTYSTLRECILDCNTEQEQEKLDALKVKVN